MQLKAHLFNFYLLENIHLPLKQLMYIIFTTGITTASATAGVNSARDN